MNTGNVWNVKQATSNAESALFFKNLVGVPHSRRSGIGIAPEKPLPTSGKKEYRKAVSDLVAQEHDQAIVSSMYSKPLQHSWLAWSAYVQNDLSWRHMPVMPPGLLQFCVQATYNTLPSPSNLVRWQILSEQSCSLCKSATCTLPHILTGCPFSVNNGRNTYRHDSVLRIFLDDLDRVISLKKKAVFKQVVPFVKAGVKGSSKSSRPTYGLLDFAKDWTILYEIGLTKLRFPPDICYIGKRPDIVLLSRSTSTMIIIELTCPCEENFEKRNMDKEDKYEEELIPFLRNSGWNCHYFSIEVGARGYNSISVSTCLKSLGFSSKQSRALLPKLSTAALKASFYIWLVRDDREWKPDPVEWKKQVVTAETSKVFCKPGMVKNRESSNLPSKSFIGPKFRPYSAVPHPSSDSIHPSPAMTAIQPPDEANSTEVTQPPVDFVVEPVPLGECAPKPVKISKPSNKSKVMNSVDLINKNDPFNPSVTTSRPRILSSSVKKKSKVAPLLTLPRGIVNMGRTCYANSCLQALLPLSSLWEQMPFNEVDRHPLLKALREALISLKTGTSFFEPYSFLAKLGSSISKTRREKFLINENQDACEVLNHILGEMVGAACVSRSALTTSFSSQTFCTVCNSRSDSEDPCFVLSVELSSSVQSSIDALFKDQSVSDRFCHYCRSSTDALVERTIIALPAYLVVQLKRFQFVNG